MQQPATRSSSALPLRAVPIVLPLSCHLPRTDAVPSPLCQESVMKNLLRVILCFAFVVGMATPSEAIICCLINKLVECPPIRKLRNESKAKKAAKKMKAKKPLGASIKKLLEHGGGRDCDCDCDADCDAECECGCD